MKDFRIIKKFFSLLLFTGFLLIFSSCGGTPKHDKKDVEEYIENVLGIENYKLNDTSEDIDKIGIVWSVKQTDQAELEFHIYDQTNYNLFGDSYSLESDFTYIATSYLAKNYNVFSNIEVLTEDSEYLVKSTYFLSSFTSRDNINKCFDEANNFIDYVNNSYYQIKCRFVFCIDKEMDESVYEIYTDEKLSDEVILASTNTCITAALGYRLDDWLNCFSESEINNVLANSDKCIGICYKDPERDEYEYYTDLIGLNSGVSIRTLYQILKKENYKVEGDQDNYSFTGKNGSSYKMDNIQNSYQIDGIEQKNSEQKYVYITLNEIQNMADLYLCIGTRDYQPNANVYAADGNLNSITTIYLNDKEMTYDTLNDSGVSNTLFKQVWYDEESNQYKIISDVGWFSNSQSYPAIIKEYVTLLGGTYKVESKTIFDNCYKSLWTINNNTWTMKSNFNKTVTSLEITKNDTIQDIDFITSENNKNICATFCVGLSVDDFASLFNLKYTIDQDKGAIFFESQTD